ncbi:unnamed protein product [Orchesella dallaii]|uniref:AF4/FMR2 family member lilli n=1 Tax=Orchesella dallaii TaxID=48710 RepID=A0ABP1PVW3_9HEXA
MLRGSSRHDGIPNKQSARERDRDRLRERQRQERQQMLPNDDKDISVGAQDLFHAPVKVKPSVDDTTTAQITNTLGNFDTVRHLILDTSSRRAVNLIGVDQGSLSGTSVATRQPPQHTFDKANLLEKSKQYFHTPLVAGQQGSSSTSLNELNERASSQHRALFNSSSNSNNNSNNTNNSGSNNSLAANDFTHIAVPNYQNSRPPGNQLHKGISASSHSQSSSSSSSQLADNNSSSSSSTNHSTSNSCAPPTLSNTSQSTAAVGGSSSSSNNSNTNSSGYTTSANNNNQVRQTALNTNNSSSAPSTVTDVSSEGYANASSAKTVTSNALLNKDSHESASGADEKNSRHASSNKKPSLERADSQLEIESMLKEMMDVTAPLTAIQTPVKETNTKKFTQRRSSKSEEKIVQSIRDSGMADVPSPVQRMDSSDSSSSYESETSDSESEDSSSGGQTGGDKIEPVIPKITPNTNSPTRWNLGSFIRKNDYRGTPNDANATTTLVGSKSPKDTKPNAHQVNAINSETSPGDVPVKTDSIVSSTSLLNKAQSLSPLDTPTVVAPVTRKSTRSTVEVKPEPYTPPKPPPPIANNVKTPNSTNNPVTKSLSSSSSEEDAEKLKKEASRAAAAAEKEEKAANATGAGKRKRKRSSSSAERVAQKSGEESSPENKNKKNIVQDRNKNDTIRRLFLSRKLDSPTRGDSSELGKSPSSGAPSTNGNGASNSTTASTAPTGNPVPSLVVGTAGGSASNRVQAKDNGKKSKENATVSNNVRNGELDASATSAGASVTETVSKKRDDSTKEKESASSRASHGKKNQKSASSASASASTSKASSNPYAPSVLLPPPPPPPAAKVKEEVVPGKSDKSLSSLVVKINLSKLKRKPNMMPAPPPPPPLAPPPPPVVIKIEKDIISEKGAKTIKEPPAATSNNADLFLKRVHHNSSRVGSSSDHAKDAKETAVVTHNPPPGRVPPDGSLCSDIDFRGKKRSKSKKVKSSSPKKTKTKHEPDSHSKVEEETVCGEVSSNVIGFASCDSVSVSTTRTPPVEADVVQAPDSSLNPPHLPSPVVPPQPVYFSYFEKGDHLATEDYYARRDQDSYLEEAKRLKHKADGERVSTTQASVYLEAGLYFILTGISMERDRTVGSTAAFTMYKDTLVLIRYIGSRFGRSRGGAEYSNPIEAKIIVLSMRCQSLLSLKLFKIKMRETKEMVQYLQDHFQRHPTIDLPPIASSPQLSTPSPHSPQSSPAASSSLHPSPHHPNQIMTSIPRSLYSNMQKTCSSTMHLISAHELWEAADQMVEKYRIEDFFVQLDRQLGPLTLHNTLVDLVRYVKHALQVLKSTSEIS